MKNVLKRVLCLALAVSLMLINCNITIFAIDNANLDWNVEVSEVDHSQLKLKISNVDKPQEVSAFFTVGGDKFEKKLVLTEQSQEFKITFDKNYPCKTKITVYLENSDSKKTADVSKTIPEHYLDGALTENLVTPKKFTSKIWGCKLTKVTATVNFETYSQDISGDKITIEYPYQKPGTDISVYYTDGTCEARQTFTVENRRLPLPTSLKITRSYIQGYNQNDDLVLNAQIGNDIYTSGKGKIYLSYPLQSIGQKITVWYEADDGSISEKITNTIEECYMGWYVTFINGYPRMTSQAAPDGADYVVARIGDEEYVGLVKKGIFKIDYPLQKEGTKVEYTAYDNHGCKSETLSG